MDLGLPKLKLQSQAQWLTVALLLVTLCLCLCVCDSATAKERPQPPTIEVSLDVTNSSVITFYNGTLIVVSKDVGAIELTCNASYPVMWSLNSLEQPWTSATSSYRHVTDFKDKSTYTYSMVVSLSNHDEDLAYHHQISLNPEEYVCHSAAGAELSTGLVSKMRVVWEAINTVHLRKGLQIVYWGPRRSDTDEILIPCFTVNANDSIVELYVYRLSNTTRTLLATQVPGSPLNSTSTGIRFEKYVGFFLKPSMLAENEETYDCRVKKLNSESSDNSEAKVEENTTATQITGVAANVTVKSTEAHSNFSSNGSLSNSTVSDEDDDDEQHDYKYIPSEDELFHPKNVTTSTEEPGGNESEHKTDSDDDDDKDGGSYISSQLFRLIKRNSSAEDPKRKGTTEEEPDTFSAYLNRKNPNLTLERMEESESVSCCVDHEDANGIYTANNMVLYRKWCDEPLMCLTKRHLLKKTYLFFWAKDDEELSTKCRHMSTAENYHITDDIKPALYICHMRTDSKLTRQQYTGDYHLGDHFETSENSYLLEAAHNHSAGTDLRYYDVERERYVNGFLNATFYDGQAARFFCTASSFFYATGKVWELHWKNGTSKILPPQDRGEEKGFDYFLQLNVTTELVRISCHLPLWNSTEWFTRSADVKVEGSSPPSSDNGQRTLSETVEFFVGESKLLSCALDGHPPPKYEWSITSSPSAYTLLERQSKYYYNYDYHDTPYYTGQSPSSYKDPKVQNVTVSVSSYYSPTDSTSPIPAGELKCVAMNVAGNGSIQFMLKAMRPELPVLGFEGRGLNRVFFVHDTARLLNCTLRKGLPQAVIYWQRHDMNITNSEHYEIRESGNSSALLFKVSIDYEDEGDYSCIATNLAGNATLRFRVQIREPSPHSSTHPAEFGLITFALLIILVIAAFAIIYVRKSRKITRLEMRAEYSKAFGNLESSRLTVATDF